MWSTPAPETEVRGSFRLGSTDVPDRLVTGITTMTLSSVLPAGFSATPPDYLAVLQLRLKRPQVQK